MYKQFFPLSFLLLVLTALAPPASAQRVAAPGSLTVMDAEGNPKSLCPLKHTDVKADISGFISRVVVTQQFVNPFNEKIEAVYTFPLPQNAAVDDMTMLIGDRTIRGKILPREEAQAVYDAAKSSGKIASLLDQERPNIFTQSVANILPGDQIKITISYVETLKYENGTYEFVFPMVVGPRYVPGAPARERQPLPVPGSQGGGFSPNTDRVPDASRITPRPVPPDTRSGHDISIEVKLDAGLIVEDVTSKTHAIEVRRLDVRSARVKLKNGATIPNKDFILRYDVAGKEIQDALLTHVSEKGRFFTMIFQPPARVGPADVTPKELIFVLDTSGSMQGFPIEKAKETMKLALDNLYPSDTFNLITFSGDTHILFPEPVPATKENLTTAQEFLQSRSGQGGTEMMTAIKAALAPSEGQSHVRIVCFMTDGYVGNDMEIVSEVQKYKNARVFSFGIGNAVNRFLLDKMAEAGRGEVEYVSLQDDGSAAARRFHERIRNPLLTDISIDWNGLPVADVYPQRIPDLFGAKPVMLTGRFLGAGRGTIRLRGKMAGSDFVREIPVEFPETMASHDVLASLWARLRIDNLMSQDFTGAQSGHMLLDLKNAITQLGIEYRLMTRFTSFVAVEEMVITDGGQLRRIDVPVEIPQGVNRMLVNDVVLRAYRISNLGFITANAPPMPGAGGGSGVGIGSGSGRGVATQSGTVALPRATPPLKRSPMTPDGRIAVDLELRQKLHAALFAVVDRVRRKEPFPTAGEHRFVRGDKAEVQIWLNDKPAEALAKLKELGFEVLLEANNSKLIIGRIPIDKLEALAALNFVRYVSPQMAR